MFRVFILTVLSLFPYYTAYSQDATLAGLMRLPDDTAKVHRLSEYCEGIVGYDPAGAESVTREIIRLSRKIGFAEGVGDGLSYLSYFKHNSGNYEGSISSSFEAIQHYLKCSDVPGLAKCLGNIAVSYYAVNKIDSAVKYRLLAINLLDRTGNRKKLSGHYLNLGALLNNNVEHQDKALFYFTKGAEIARQFKDTSKLIMCLSGVSHVLTDLGKVHEALRADEEAFRLAHNTRDYMAASYAYENHAHVLLWQNRIDTAITVARQGIRYADTADYMDGYFLGTVMLGKALGEKKDYRGQAAVLAEALELANQLNNMQMFESIYEGLATAHYQLGNFKQAYDYRRLTAVYSDSTRADRMNNKILELEVKYKTAQKEKEIYSSQLYIARQDAALQKSKYYIYSAVAGFVLLLVLTAFLYAGYRNKKTEYRRKLIAAQREKEIGLLQAQAQGEEKERSRIAKDLHDGVAGMLAAVKMHLSSIAPDYPGLKATEGYRMGLKLLDEASGEVRKTSHNLMPEVLLQHGLDTALRRFCLSISNSRALMVQYDSLGDVGRFLDSFELSVYRIIQELINNIVRHSGARQAIVQLSYREQVLVVTVEDDGVGFDADKLPGKGTGLHSLQARIRAINGRMALDAVPGNGVSAYLEFETAGLEAESPVFA